MLPDNNFSVNFPIVFGAKKTAVLDGGGGGGEDLLPFPGIFPSSREKQNLLYGNSSGSKNHF